MVWHNALRMAIVAIYKGICIFKFRRHWLAHDGPIKVSEVSLHVCNTLATNGAAI